MCFFLISKKNVLWSGCDQPFEFIFIGTLRPCFFFETEMTKNDRFFGTENQAVNDGSDTGREFQT